MPSEERTIEVRELDMDQLIQRRDTKETSERGLTGPWISNNGSISALPGGSMRLSTPRQPAPPADLLLIFAKELLPAPQLLRGICDTLHSRSMINITPGTKIVGYKTAKEHWGESQLQGIINDLLLVDFPEFCQKNTWANGVLDLTFSSNEYVVDFYSDVGKIFSRNDLALAVIHKPAVGR